MKRRSLLAGAAAGAAISATDWLTYFKRWGVPGTAKLHSMAEAAAADLANPHYLIYWFLEGGWDSYSMFSPVDTNNDATTDWGQTLTPSTPWSAQRYRPRGWDSTAPRTQVSGEISYGFLAAPGVPLFPDMAIVSSHYGGTFHSGSRFNYHYGVYGANLRSQRGADERSVMQAFCEAYGASYLVPHLSWHRWLSDGELSFAEYPPGTGYYENLGPSYAHTIYARTPGAMRAYLQSIKDASGSARDEAIRSFADNFHQKVTSEKDGQSVQAFASAVAAYKSLVSGTAAGLNPDAMFSNQTLHDEFGVASGDLQSTSTSVNGNPARSKESPNTNVQAMMTYEMMINGLSCGFFIESRDVRLFDSHRNRYDIFGNDGQHNQKPEMDKNLWSPLQALVAKLKNTPHPNNTGKSYWDYTNIAICSEMGRSIYGAIDGLGTVDQVMKQDVSAHWDVSSVAFLGGNVKGGKQYGRIGNQTLEPIPMMPDGTLDPAYNPNTGQLQGNKSPNSFISNAGHVYATALALSGINPAGKGRNTQPELPFIKKA